MLSTDSLVETYNQSNFSRIAATDDIYNSLLKVAKSGTDVLETVSKTLNVSPNPDQNFVPVNLNGNADMGEGII